MNDFDNGELSIEIVQELRTLAERGADVPELTDHLQLRLGIPPECMLFPALLYFRTAFCLSLREALPLREWIAGKDRSEVDSLLIPAMMRNKANWQPKQLQGIA